MKKTKISKLISKYALNGTIETVLIKTNNKNTVVEFTHPDKTLIGKTEMKNSDLKDSELGIFDTTKLIQMLGILSEDIDFNVVEVNNNPVNIELKDNSYNLVFVLADSSIIPTAATLKSTPPFEISIDVNNDFVNRFLNALKAVPAESVTFIPSNDTIDVVVGYSSTSNTNKVKFTQKASCSSSTSTTFSTEHLKNILTSNRDCTGKIEISSQGLMKLSFNEPDFDSEYYVVQASLN